MRSLKILMLCSRVPWPLNDGGNRATYLLAKQLSKAGHKVDLCALNTSKHYQEKENIPWTGELYLQDIDTSLSPWQAFKNLFSPLPYNVSRFESHAFTELLSQVLTTTMYDIVQLEGSYMSLYTACIKANSSARMILRSHNVEFEIWKRLAQEESNPIKKAYLNYMWPGIARFEQENLREYDGLLPITERDKETYVAMGWTQDACVLEAGAVISSPRVPFSEKVLNIGFIGSMEWLPNLNGINWFLKDVWPSVHERFPEVKLNIAGKKMPKHLLNLNQAGVNVAGEVKDAEIFMRNQEVMVIPLFAGGGMRLKAIEALGQGCCVVGTPIGLEGIKGQPGEAYIITDNAEQMKTQLGRLIGDPEACARIGEAGRKMVETNYGWQSLVKKAEAFYFSLL